METGKTCSKCKVTKPLSAFSAHRGAKSSKSGVRSTCKSCDTEWNRIYRSKNREKVNAAKRNWAANNKDKIAEFDRAYRENNKDKIAATHKKWYEANREYVSEKSKLYNLENREKKADTYKKWSANNKDKIAAAGRRWRKNNPEKAKLVRQNNEAKNPFRQRLKQHKRRLRIIENGLFLVTSKDAKKLLAGCCFYCSEPAEHIDHVIPVARGGRHSIGNLVGACQKCNQSKGSKFITEWNKVRLI